MVGRLRDVARGQLKKVSSYADNIFEDLKSIQITLDEDITTFGGNGDIREMADGKEQILAVLEQTSLSEKVAHYLAVFVGRRKKTKGAMIESRLASGQHAVITKTSELKIYTDAAF